MPTNWIEKIADLIDCSRGLTESALAAECARRGVDTDLYFASISRFGVNRVESIAKIVELEVEIATLTARLSGLNCGPNHE